MKRVFTLLLFLFCMSVNLFSQTDKDLFLWWDFNDTKEIKDPSYSDMEEEEFTNSTREKINGNDYRITCGIMYYSKKFYYLREVQEKEELNKDL